MFLVWSAIVLRTFADCMRIAVVGMTVMALGMKLTRILFGNNAEATISKEDLTHEILELTKPSEINKSIDNGDISTIMLMSFELGIVFMTLVDKLFPESEND